MASKIGETWRDIAVPFSAGDQTTTQSSAARSRSANILASSSFTTTTQAIDSAGKGESRAVGPVIAGTRFRQLATFVVGEVWARRYSRTAR